MPKNTLPTRTVHGIDMSAPDAIEQLLAHHRATFGNAVMLAATDGTDGEDQDDADDAGDGDDGEDQDDADDAGEGDDGDAEGGDAGLGDKGKRALDSMKAKWKAEKKRAADAVAERDQLKAEKDNAGKAPEEQALEAARAEARAEALAAGSKRILRSEVKAAASKKLANPALAVKLIDLDDLEVDDDGNVDEDAIAEAIDDLLKENPFLAAQGAGVRFDSARGKSQRKQQLSRQDLKGMTPEQIAKAYDEGRIKG